VINPSLPEVGSPSLRLLLGMGETTEFVAAKQSDCPRADGELSTGG